MRLDLEEDQRGVPLVEDISDAESASQVSKKRKRDGEDSAPQSKRAAKRKKTKKPKDVDDEALDVELGVNHAIAHMDSQLMADHIAQRTKRFHPDISLVEVEDIYIPEKAILDTTSWEQPRVADNLPMYMEQFAGSRRKKKGHKLTDAPQENGHPHTLVVAGAGQRAADLTRPLRKFQGQQAKVAKLFAKHIKLKEAIETVKTTRMNIGVGTPQRIIDLLDDGSLSISNLERIIVDASYIDQKKRGILDMKETQAPLVKLLTRKDLKERYGAAEGKVELLFY